MKEYINKHSAATFIFIVIEQSLVASSTFFITQLGRCIQSSKIEFWFILFICSLALVFIPRYFIQICITKAKYYTFQNTIMEYGCNLFNRPYLRTSRDFCKDTQPFFVNQTWQITNETYDFLLDFITVILNVILNVIVIVTSLSNAFLVGYGISLLIILFILFLYRGGIQRRSVGVQQFQAKMNETLPFGWDTILIGNTYNYTYWKKLFKDRTGDAVKKDLDYHSFANLGSILAMGISIFPIALIILSLILKNRNDTAALAALIVTLPRQVSNIQNLSVVIELAMELNGIMAKVKDLHRTTMLPAHIENFTGNICWDKIKVCVNDSEYKINSFQDIKKITNVFSNGRFTVRGSNGTGKSTLLMHLKERLGKIAYYLPASSNLFFQDTYMHGLSTGQKIVSNLHELIGNTDGIRVLLLDEWDANLDAQNLKIISDIIDKESKMYCIIEVRHKN